MPNFLRRCCRYLFPIAIGCSLQACTKPTLAPELSKNTLVEKHRGLPEHSGSNNYCVGRLMLSSDRVIEFTKSEYKFYWGEVNTYRQSPAEYERRLLNVQTPPESGVRVPVQPAIRFHPNAGMLSVVHEEDKPPADPNVVTVIGYGYHDGTTFEFKKQTVANLREVAKQRTIEILRSVNGNQTPHGLPTTSGFCVTHGVIGVSPLPGWFEASNIEGKFTFEGQAYRFSLRSRQISSEKNNELELADQRERIKEQFDGSEIEAQEIPLSTSATNALSEFNGTVRLLKIHAADTTKTIYEWYRAAKPNDVFQPAIFLNIWIDDKAEGATSTAQIEKILTTHQGQQTPLFKIAQSDRAVGPMKIEPVHEESKAVYRPRLAYYDVAAPNRHYKFFKNGTIVVDGRSDAAGYTKAQNTDYLERWSISVLSD